MSERQPFRAGDTVKHVHSGETWTLACDQEGEYVNWFGWPDGEAHAEHCELIGSASDEVRLTTLRQVSRSRGDDGGLSRRALIALRQLHAGRQCEAPCHLCADEREQALSEARTILLEAATLETRAEQRERELLAAACAMPLTKWLQETDVRAIRHGSCVALGGAA